MNVKKFILRLMYASVGLAGLMTAIIILVSPGGNTVGKGISTAFLIFVADGIILLSLLAKHEWLKISTWITAIYSLTMATIYTWLPKGWYDYENYRRSDTLELAKIRETAETFGWLTFGGYILASALVIAVLFSLLRKSVSDTDKLVKYSYLGTLGLGIASGVVLALSASIHEGGMLLRFGFALMFLALTAAIITFISMAVSSSKAKAERREEQYKYYQQNPEAAYAHSHYAAQPYGAPQQGHPQQNYGPDYTRQPYQNMNVPPVPQAPPNIMPAPPIAPAPQYPAQPSHPPFHSGQSQPPFAPPAPPAPPTQNP